MKKIISSIVLLLIVLLCTSPVFALTINTGNTENNESISNSENSQNNEQSSNGVVSSITTLELVERNTCEIDLLEPSTNNVIGEFSKELTNFDSRKKEATLTLTLKNVMEEAQSVKPVEIYLVLDNSSSMGKTYDGKSKIDYVSETANDFVDYLFNHFQNPKIGIVSFSCAESASAVNENFNDGTENDAKLVLELSDSQETVKSKITEYKNNEQGIHTNIEAGLTMAENNFTDNTDSEKYIILLSDGVPNLCLNTETTLQYSGVIASSTKAKLQDLDSNGYHIYSVLMGLNEAELENPSAPVNESTGNKMTYRELAEEIFGSTSDPTAGSFYYINYDNLDKTINTDIFNEIAQPIKDSSLKDIVIKDYFPQEIIDNFNFKYVASPNIGEVSQEVDTSDNSITWNIELLNAGEVATLEYTLTLKDDYNKEIVDKILPTNTNVDIDYNYNNTDGKVSSDVAPTVKVQYLESSKDDTVAKKPIPQTGLYGTILFAIVVVGIVTFAIVKAVQIKKLK